MRYCRFALHSITTMIAYFFLRQLLVLHLYSQKWSFWKGNPTCLESLCQQMVYVLAMILLLFFSALRLDCLCSYVWYAVSGFTWPECLNRKTTTFVDRRVNYMHGCFTPKKSRGKNRRAKDEFNRNQPKKVAIDHVCAYGMLVNSTIFHLTGRFNVWHFEAQ